MYDRVILGRCDLLGRTDRGDSSAVVEGERVVRARWRAGAIDQPFRNDDRPHTFSRGSNASRRPSPIRFKASIVSMIDTPGNVAIHQCSRKYWRPSLSMRPHSGAGG